jgi:hypothetical protein
MQPLFDIRDIQYLAPDAQKILVDALRAQTFVALARQERESKELHDLRMRYEKEHIKILNKQQQQFELARQSIDLKIHSELAYSQAQDNHKLDLKLRESQPIAQPISTPVSAPVSEPVTAEPVADEPELKSAMSRLEGVLAKGLRVAEPNKVAKLACRFHSSAVNYYNSLLDGILEDLDSEAAVEISRKTKIKETFTDPEMLFMLEIYGKLNAFSAIIDYPLVNIRSETKARLDQYLPKCLQIREKLLSWLTESDRSENFGELNVANLVKAPYFKNLLYYAINPFEQPGANVELRYNGRLNDINVCGLGFLNPRSLWEQGKRFEDNLDAVAIRNRCTKRVINDFYRTLSAYCKPA